MDAMPERRICSFAFDQDHQSRCSQHKSRISRSTNQTSLTSLHPSRYIVPSAEATPTAATSLKYSNRVGPCGLYVVEAGNEMRCSEHVMKNDTIVSDEQIGRGGLKAAIEQSTSELLAQTSLKKTK